MYDQHSHHNEPTIPCENILNSCSARFAPQLPWSDQAPSFLVTNQRSRSRAKAGFSNIHTCTSFGFLQKQQTRSAFWQTTRFFVSAVLLECRWFSFYREDWRTPRTARSLTKPWHLTSDQEHPFAKKEITQESGCAGVQDVGKKAKWSVQKSISLTDKSPHNIHIEQEESVSSTTDTTKRDFSLLKSGCYTPQEPRGAHQWKLNIF